MRDYSFLISAMRCARTFWCKVDGSIDQKKTLDNRYFTVITLQNTFCYNKIKRLSGFKWVKRLTKVCGLSDLVLFRELDFKSEARILGRSGALAAQQLCAAARLLVFNRVAVRKTFS